MQLRDASRSQRPGRYREYTGPTNVDRPAFVHDDPSFDAEVVDHCAFPSLDMHHPGPGPSAVWKIRHKLEEEAAKHPVIVIDCDQEKSDEADSASEDDDQVQENLLHNEDANDDEDDQDSLLSSRPPRCSSADTDIPYRLILTARDMSKLGHGEAGIEQHDHQPKDSNTDNDGDTIMESSAQGSGGNDQRPRRFAVSVVRRPRSPVYSPLEPSPLGRRARTVSLGFRAPRTAARHDEPPSPEMVPSPVEEDFWFKDIFEPETDWSMPSHVDDGSATEETPMVTNIFKTYPNWTDLSDGVKFIIIYDMTQNGLSFTRACSKLGLGFDDMSEMIELVRVQRRKIYKNNRAVAQQNGNSVEAWLEKDCPVPREEAPVTDHLTEDEIRRGKAFLKFMGLNDVAANMGSYLGSSIGDAAEDYNIPLNHFREDGWQRLIPHFLVGCQEKVEIMWLEWKRLRELRPPVMSIGEMHVRMDAPPDTVNPRRLLPSFQSARRRQAEEVDTRGVLPLHLDNFLDLLPDGTIFNGLDGRVITLEERAATLYELEMKALRQRRGRFPTMAPPAVSHELNVAQSQISGQPVAHGAGPMDIEDRPDVGQRMPPGGRDGHQLTSLPVDHQQLADARQSIQDTAEVPTQNKEGHLEDAQLDTGIRRRTHGPRPESLSVPDPVARLEDDVGSVLKKYQHFLAVPSRSSRASLSRRSQSLEFNPEQELVVSSSAGPNKKKKVQFEDEGHSDYEESSPRKKKTPEEKDKRQDAAPRATARPVQSAGSRRSSLDAWSTPVTPRLNKKNKRGIVADDDDYTDDDNTNSSPLAPSSPLITPRDPPHTAGNSGYLQTDYRPTPTKRGDHTAELELLANKIASRSVKQLADEYSLKPKNTDQHEASPAPRRRLTRAPPKGFGNETATATSTADIAVPSEPRVAGLGQPNKEGTGLASQPSVEAPAADFPVPSPRAGTQEQDELAHGQSQPVQPVPQPGIPAEEQVQGPMPEPGSVLTGPPASCEAGNEQVRQTITFPELSCTHETTRSPDPNIKDCPPEGSSQMSVASSRSNARFLPIENPTGQDQTFSSARFEAPMPGAELPNSGSDTPLNGPEAVKEGEADNLVIEKAPKGKKDASKRKNKRKSGDSVGEAKSDDGSKTGPPKRQSTTPIPLPVIPGMPALGNSSQRHTPDIRKPASNLGNLSNRESSQPNPQGPGRARSGNIPRPEPKSLLSEEQIRKMGARRAEVEIYKNRERAKLAAASRNKSFQNGSSIGSNSSPLSVNSAFPGGPSSSVVETPSLETPTSQRTSPSSVPVASQLTVGSSDSPHPSMGRHGTLLTQSSPPMPSVHGSHGVKTNNTSGTLKRTPSGTAISPQVNIPQSFASEHTTSYIQAQDESISKAFALAKERTHGVCLPSGGKRSGVLVPRPPVGSGQSVVVPRPAGADGQSVIVQRYNQPVSGQRIQVGNPQRRRDMASGAGSAGFEGYVPNMSGAVPSPTQKGTSAARMSPMAGSMSNVTHYDYMTSKLGTGQQSWRPASTPPGFHTGTGAEAGYQNTNTTHYSPPAQLTSDYVAGAHHQTRPGGQNTFSPLLVSQSMVPASQEQIQRQRQAQLRQGNGFSMAQGQGPAMGMSPLLLPGAGMSTWSPAAQPPVQVQNQAAAPTLTPTSWTMHTVDMGPPFLEGSLNDLGLGWELGTISSQNLNQAENQDQAQAQAQQQPMSDFGFGSSMSGFQFDLGNSSQSLDQERDQEQGQGQGQDQDQSQNQGQNDQNQNQGQNFLQQELEAAASSGQVESTFTEMLGSTGMDFYFYFDSALDLVIGTGTETDTGTDTRTSLSLGIEADVAAGGSGGVDLDAGMDIDIDMNIEVGIGAIDPRILEGLRDLRGLGDTDIEEMGDVGDVEMES